MDSIGKSAKKLMNDLIKFRFTKILKHPLLFLLARLILGGIFLFAAMPKIENPARFAEDIRGYQILPYWKVHAVAITMPAIELVLAVCLILGIWMREAALMMNGLLIVFIVAIASTVWRGIEVNCGCFGETLQETTGLSVIFRDVLFLLPGLYIFFWDQGRLSLFSALRKMICKSEEK